MSELDRRVLEMLARRLTVGEIAARLGVRRSEAAATLLRVIDQHGDPGLEELDRHIATLRRVNVRA